MTLEEMRDKIKEYESKWGKLGHTNIMKPEKYTIEHSGLSKGETKMPNMTNDFYAFRRKVAEGKEKNKIAHTATINITDLNKRYFEQITTDGTLIHASTNSNYGKKYYQKIDKYYADGSARYFWSPQEWEAYQKEKGQDAYRKQQQATTNANTAKQTSGGAKSQDDIEAQKNRQADKAAKKAEKDEGEKSAKETMLNERSNAEKKAIDKTVKENNEKIEKESNAKEPLVRVYSVFDNFKTKKKPRGTKFSVEHSAINEEDSVMSEYRAFKQRANEGAKRNRLSHSAVISPADLNAKYYQDIEDHCFLVHASTQYGKGYYQKIEKFYPDGSTRYFYTPQEWEAYQKNKGQNNKPSVNQTYYLKPAGTNEKIEAYKKANQELKEKKANESAVKQFVSPIKSLAKGLDKQWDAFVDTIEDGKSEEGKRLKDSSKALKKYFKKSTHKLKDAEDIANEVLAKYGYKDYDDMLNKEYFDKYPEVVDKKSLTEYTDEEKAAGKEFLNKTVKIANEIKEAQAAEAEKQEKAYELAEEADKQVDIFDDIHKEINLLNSTKRADLADALGVKSLSEKDIINVFMPEINEMEDKFDAGDYNDTYGVEFFQAIIDGMEKFRAAYREARKEIGMD